MGGWPSYCAITPERIIRPSDNWSLFILARSEENNTSIGGAGRWSRVQTEGAVGGWPAYYVITSANTIMKLAHWTLFMLARREEDNMSVGGAGGSAVFRGVKGDYKSQGQARIRTSRRLCRTQRQTVSIHSKKESMAGETSGSGYDQTCAVDGHGFRRLHLFGN